MKKFLSLVLAFSVVMMSMVIVPISAGATAMSLPVSDDFNASTLDTDKWTQVTGANESPGASIIDGTDYGADSNVVKLDGNLYANFGKKDFVTNPTSFRVKYDLYVSEGFKSELKLRGASGFALLYLQQLNLKYGAGDNGGGQGMALTAKTWYNVDYRVNTSTGASHMIITTKGGASTLITGKFNTSELKAANEINFNWSAKTAGDYVLIDNLSIEDYEFPTYELPISEDFTNGLDIVKWNTAKSAYAEVVADPKNESNKVVKTFGSGFSGSVGVALDEAITTGSINVNFDYYMPSTGGQESVVTAGTANNDSNELMRVYPDGRIDPIGFKWTPNLGTDKWVNIDLTYDLETLKCILRATPEGGEVQVKTAAITDTAVKTTSQFSFGTKSGTGNGNYILFDNISIKKAASLKWELPVSDDFEDGLDTIKWNGSNSTYAATMTDPTNADNTAAKIFGTGFSKSVGIVLDEAITTGSINVNFDYYVPSSNAAEIIVSAGQEVNDSSELMRVYGDGRVDPIGFGATVATATATWVDVDLTYDLETRKAIFNITPAGGTTTTKVGTITDTGIQTVTQITFSTKGAVSTENYMLIDNVSIKKAASLKWELPISDDFTDGMDFIKWNASNTAHVAIIDDPKNAGNNVAKCFGSGMADSIGVKLDEAITTGKINVKFDYYMPAGAGQETMVTAGSKSDTDNELLRLYNDGRVELPGGGFVGTLSVGQWNTVDMVYDLTTLAATVTVTPESGAALKGAGTLQDAAVASTSQFTFGVKYGADEATKNNYVLFDDISISKYYEVPAISGVTFVKYDDTTSTALTSVSAGTKQIIVQLNTPMDDTTLDKDTIKLVNKATSLAEEYTGAYDKTAMTWTIPLATYLEAGATYELTITSGAKNEAGTAAAGVPVEFATDEGEYKVSLAAYKGDTLVTELSQLTTGDEITVKAAVINTTGEPQKLQLIYGGYNNTLLIAYNGLSKDIAKTDKNITIDEFKVTVDKTDMTHINLFAWDSYGTLRALTAPTPID